MLTELAYSSHGIEHSDTLKGRQPLWPSELTHQHPRGLQQTDSHPPSLYPADVRFDSEYEEHSQPPRANGATGFRELIMGQRVEEEWS